MFLRHMLYFGLYIYDVRPSLGVFCRNPGVDHGPPPDCLAFLQDFFTPFYVNYPRQKILVNFENFNFFKSLARFDISEKIIKNENIHY